MLSKDILRNKFLKKRKKKHRKVKNFFFDPLKKIIKKIKKTSVCIAIYMPINYELDPLLSMNIQSSKKIYFLAPIVTDKNNMNFFNIKKNDVFQVNKYGILEPITTKKKSYLPDIILLPLLAYDKNNYRLGYGKGYYDHYLNNQKKKIKTIGIAYSFQETNKIPVNKHDVKMDYILTEKGLNWFKWIF